MNVLILGATSPIARAIAENYGREGASVCLAARDREELDRVGSDLRIRTGTQIWTEVFDALDFESHHDFLERVESKAGGLDVVLFAFGFMGVQEESEADFDAARKVIEVNYTGAVSIAEKTAARMAERGRGTMIGISSVAGDRGRASNYIYGSAKGAFTLYLQGVRNRLAASGVRVLTVKLGFVDTRMTFGLDTAIPVKSPEAAAAAIVAAQRRGAETIYYPPFWRGVMSIIKAVPEKIFKELSL